MILTVSLLEQKENFVFVLYRHACPDDWCIYGCDSLLVSDVT